MKTLLFTIALLALLACKSGDTTAIKAPTGSKVWLLTIQAQGGSACWQIGIRGDGKAIVEHGPDLLDGEARSFTVNGETLEEAFVDICGGGTGDLAASFSEVLTDGTQERRDAILTGWSTRLFFYDGEGWL